MADRLLVYGAGGFTGGLIAREAVRRGRAPILAGRRAEPLEPLARELGLEIRLAPLDDPSALARLLDGVSVVLHAAGPFVRTSRPMVDACLAAKVSYLDITGEIAVFEEIFRRDAEARATGVALVPGVGFDVVPSDALADELHRALPDAGRLELAFASTPGASWSRGTLATAIEGLPAVGWERRGGHLVPARPLSVTRQIDFPGLGRRLVLQIPWGDLATAFRTTGVPDVATFAALPPRTIRWARRARPLLPVLGLGPVKRLLQRIVRARVTGPGPEAATARVHLWGRATAPSGAVVERALSVPEAYAFTASSAVEAARRALAGGVAPGAWTPTLAFGRELLDALPGVRRESAGAAA
jgi:short subunit dehydrogenase-like uncharacterized protein